MKNSKYFFRLFILIFLLSFLGCVPSLNRFTDNYNRFFSYYDNLLKKEPNNLELRINFAKACFDFKDYQKVKELLSGVDDERAKIILAKALSKSKEYTKALEVFDKVKDQLTQPEDLYLYGRTLEEKNLYPRAIEVYKKVGGNFKELAKERISQIKIKVVKKTPAYISNLSKKAGSFVKKAKDDAAIILLADEKTEITPLHTSISTIHIIEQVLKDRGKDLAEVEIGYDSTYERVELEFARTITKDGRIIYAGKENTRDVSKYLNFPLYSNAKVLIISMPSVEVGSIIEYKAKIYSSKLINKDDFTILYHLREKYPIYQEKFNLVVPEKKEVYFKFLNTKYCKLNLNPLLKKEGNKKIYSFNFKKIKSLIPENNMPPASYVNPAILISSFKSWQEIYDWWHSLYKNKITLEESGNFVKDLIKGTKSDYEKAKVIYEYVEKNIRYVAVEYGESGYEPHKAEKVFLNRYGDCKDQAILLVAMLRKAGLKSYPVLIPTKKAYKISKDFPSVNFNHAIAAVKIKNKFIFMDATAQTTTFSDLPFSDQGRNVLVSLDNGYKILKTPDLKNNEVFYKMLIDITKDEDAHINRVVTTRGAFASYQRWYLKYTRPSKIKEDIHKRMTEISPFSELLNYKVENIDDFDKSPKLEYSFKTKKFLNPAKNLRIIPPLNEINLDYALVSKKKRDFPIDFGGIIKKKASIQINLPSNLRVKYLPANIDLETAWFNFKLSYKYEKEKRIINFYQEFAVKEKFVKVAEYNNFKKAIEKALYSLRGEIILEQH